MMVASPPSLEKATESFPPHLEDAPETSTLPLKETMEPLSETPASSPLPEHRDVLPVPSTSSSQLPPLWYLPEILIMVRAYADMYSFAALCQTSKGIYRLGHKFLYESIHLRLHRQHPESLSLLWRTIEKNSSLAVHIKSLRLEFCDPSGPYDSISEYDRRAQRNQYYSQSSMIPKITDICSNLKVISITHPYTLPETVEQGINKSLSNAHQLQELDLIILDTGGVPHIPGQHHDINISLISSALRIESLHTFSLTIQQGPESLLPAVTLALPATSNITSLSLDQAYLSMEPFGKIMRVLSHLKHLSLSFAWHADPVNSQVGEFLECKQLGEALSYRSSTLESLKIDVEFESWSALDVGGGSAPWSHWGLRHSIGNLRSFTKLVSLELAPEVLLGWKDAKPLPLSELLPDSLRHLNFRYDFGDWQHSPWDHEVLCKVAVDYLSTLPQLESLALTCENDYPPHPELQAPFLSVKAKCEERQIKCRLQTVVF